MLIMIGAGRRDHQPAGGPYSFYTLATGKLNADKAVDIGTIGTITNVMPLIGDHSYSITNVWKDASGTVWVTTRYPWGSRWIFAGFQSFGWTGNDELLDAVRGCGVHDSDELTKKPEAGSQKPEVERGGGDYAERE